MTLKIYAIYMATLSLVTFFLYLIDKRKAKRGAWRISEKALLTASFVGGAVGGYAAMQLARHKTKHWYFHVVNLLGLLWQVAALVYLCFHPQFLLGA